MSVLISKQKRSWIFQLNSILRAIDERFHWTTAFSALVIKTCNLVCQLFCDLWLWKLNCLLRRPCFSYCMRYKCTRFKWSAFLWCFLKTFSILKTNKKPLKFDHEINNHKKKCTEIYFNIWATFDSMQWRMGVDAIIYSRIIKWKRIF